MFRTSWMPSTTQNQSRMAPWMLPETKAGSLAEYPSLLKAQADKFAPITLENMVSVALLNRTETKFTMPIGKLLSILPAIRQDYQMLSVCGQRLSHYRTLYFDTPDFDLYRMHVNGYADRYKVRSREYTVSGLSFLEVKQSEKVIEVTPLEFLVLEMLMQSVGRVVKRADLCMRLMEHGYSGSEATLKIHIRILRLKLEDDLNQPQYIETVFGVGYRFNAPIRPSAWQPWSGSWSLWRWVFPRRKDTSTDPPPDQCIAGPCAW